MSAMNLMIEHAKAAPKHIVLAEGDDPRIIEAAVKASRDKIAAITLLGAEDSLRPLTRAAGDVDDNITILNPSAAPQTQTYSEALYALKRHKGMDGAEAHQTAAMPLNFANMMVRQGDADGSVSGAVHTTGAVVRSALQIIGTREGNSLVSSFFIMILPETGQNLAGPVIYSDCGLVIAPDVDQLTEIASAASDNAKALLGIDPKIALLSFATRDSALHPHVEKMRQVLERLKTQRPELIADGPLQFDAAIMPDIAARKAEGSDVAGQANVFVFPDLNAGNIAYKITERLGGAKAIGPILQGLAKPANDLSRGCKAEDIYNMIVVTVLQAQPV